MVYKRSIALYEFMSCFVMSLCTHLPHPESSTPVSSATTIIDFEDASLLSLWNLRHHLQEASVLATSNYPETLNTTAVVNCPSFFPTIWGWVKVTFYLPNIRIIVHPTPLDVV
jgi:CRAL/TRIO domain